MPENTNISYWIHQIKSGDSEAANRIWQHYFESLTKAVRNRINGQNLALSDEEDIALSVLNSFYNAAQQGRFPDLTDRYNLWQVLLKMSFRKVIDKHRYDHRQRRGGDHQLQSLNNDELPLDLIGDEPPPEMLMMMEESFEQLLSHLGKGQLRDLAVAKLEGFSNAELAAKFECSERTIERRLNLIREKCQQELIGEEEE